MYVTYENGFFCEHVFCCLSLTIRAFGKTKIKRRVTAGWSFADDILIFTTFNPIFDISCIGQTSSIEYNEEMADSIWYIFDSLGRRAHRIPWMIAVCRCHGSLGPCRVQNTARSPYSAEKEWKYRQNCNNEFELFLLKWRILIMVIWNDSTSNNLSLLFCVFIMKSNNSQNHDAGTCYDGTTM